MRHASTRVIAAILALLPGVSPVLPLHAAPLSGVHGIGASAILDHPASWSVNPALLAARQSRELWSGMLAQSGVDLLHGQWTQPTLHGPNWGLGLQQQRGAPSSSANWIHTAQLGLAQAIGSGWRTGGNLQLWNTTEVHDYSASAGLLYGSSGQRHAAQYQLAAVVNNLLEPHSESLGADAQRSFDVAASFGHPLSAVWSLSSSAGFRAGKNLRREASVAAVLRWNQRLEFGLGLQASHLRLAAGVRSRAWSVHWAHHGVAAGGAHELGVRWSWGTSLRQQMEVLEKQQASHSRARVDSAVAEFEATQLTQWKRFAQTAFEMGDLNRAASFFSMVLAGYPDDVEARVGFAHSRHAMFVTEADSLMQRFEYGGAARALEEALQINPSDSTSAIRLREVRRAARFAFRQQTDTEQLFRQGIDAFAQQSYLKAISAFRGVLALDPAHNMANSYLSQAEQAHRSRLENTLRTAEQRLNGGDFTAARKQLHRLLVDEPDQTEALQMLARIDGAERLKQAEDRRRQQNARRLAKAQEAAATAAQQVAAQEDAAPAPPTEIVVATYEEGIRLYRTGNLVAAMQAWEEVASQTPHYEDVEGYLLRVYRVTGLEKYTEGHLQEAVDIWGKALQLDPENRQLRRYLNQAQAKLKRANERTGSKG